jgi:membrane protein
MRIRKRALLQKFFADRGTHLAAMIAYYALVSFVPLVFLAVALLGLAGRADASSFFVDELRRAFPGSSVGSILTLVHALQDNATAIGIIGGGLLLWSALGLFSALESAINIVYGRPNRSFLQGKGLAALLMVGSLLTLFAGLVAGAFGVEVLKRAVPGLPANSGLAFAVSIGVSLLAVFIFLLSVYRLLPNVDVTVREVLPGAVFAAIGLEASFQVLPSFVRLADVNITLRAFGAPVLLLIWLYVMANVIVFGAEVNWWVRERRSQQREAAEEAPGLA